MLTVPWYLSICSNIFEVLMQPQTNSINQSFGGLEPWGSNYAFVTSTSDPFRALVVNETNLLNSEIIRVTTIGKFLF